LDDAAPAKSSSGSKRKLSKTGASGSKKLQRTGAKYGIVETKTPARPAKATVKATPKVSCTSYALPLTLISSILTGQDFLLYVRMHAGIGI
jgi:hypothetical protein